MQRQYSQHYKKLLTTVESSLNGPRSISIGTEFWGSRYLALQTLNIPRIEGMIESRIIYANHSDLTQTIALLRVAIWDAKSIWQTILEDSRLGREISIVSSQPSLKFVQVQIDQVHKMIQLVEQCSIPCKPSNPSLNTSEIYQLQIERGDRTMLKASWGVHWDGAFSTLSTTWRKIWMNMNDELGETEAVICEENWS